MRALRLLTTVLIGSALVAASASVSRSQQEYLSTSEAPPSPVSTSAVPLSQPVVGGAESAASTTNTVLWRQYQALHAGGPAGEFQHCSGAGSAGYDRCGQGYFPWFNGPGRCDQWCIGPKWSVKADGLLLFRDPAALGLLTGAAGDVFSFQEQFDHGPGARLFVTGYNESGFGLQVGYEGVNDWIATRAFTQGTTAHTFDYESRLNSIEINLLPTVPYAWRFFTGFRYVEMSENLIDSTIAEKPFPNPPGPLLPPIQDTIQGNLIKNRLIGVQLGAVRDAWQWTNWFSVETFCNAGIYCNKFRRDDVTSQIATTLYGDDPTTIDVDETVEVVSTSQTRVRTDISQVAFVGEAGITGVVQINPCVALRAGYEVMTLDGVGEALTASLGPGLNSSTLVYHGLQFGVEYRR